MEVKRAITGENNLHAQTKAQSPPTTSTPFEM